MKRFTLIIDGHNFFFRSLWSAFRQGHKNKILTSQKDVDTFEKKLMLDFCSVVKMMNPIVNDIVFVKDSHSWRKDLRAWVQRVWFFNLQKKVPIR